MAGVNVNQVNQNKGDVNNRAKPNRVADLAAILFADLFIQARGQTVAAKLAEDAIEAAKDFFKVVDQSEG